MIDRAANNPAQANSQLTLISMSPRAVHMWCQLFSYWLANNPREFQQLRWAAAIGDKAQPATSILVQTLCKKFFELLVAALG